MLGYYYFVHLLMRLFLGCKTEKAQSGLVLKCHC